MGALLVAILATLVGGGAGATLAARSASQRAEDPRAPVARWIVTVLGGAAGALISSQVYELVHELQLNSRFGGEPANQSAGALGLVRLVPSLDLVAVTDALRDILFYGVLLIGLAVTIELIAARCASPEPAVAADSK